MITISESRALTTIWWAYSKVKPKLVVATALSVEMMVCTKKYRELGVIIFCEDQILSQVSRN